MLCWPSRDRRSRPLAFGVDHSSSSEGHLLAARPALASHVATEPLKARTWKASLACSRDTLLCVVQRGGTDGAVPVLRGCRRF